MTRQRTSQAGESSNNILKEAVVENSSSMFGAGSDTTASAISVSVLAAACYPEAQAKVQEELDMVVGRDRGKHVWTSAGFENLT